MKTRMARGLLALKYSLGSNWGLVLRQLGALWAAPAVPTSQTSLGENVVQTSLRALSPHRDDKARGGPRGSSNDAAWR